MADETQGQGIGDAAQSTGNRDGQQAGKTFTQAELDAIIADRLGRERQRYADYEDLKKAAAKLKEIEDASKGEAQKLQEQLQALQAENTSLKTQVQTARAERAAAKGGALYPDLVAAKVPADTMNDEKKLEAAINDIKKTYPALFGKAGGSADGGAGGGKMGSSMNDFIRRAAGRT